MAAMVVTERHLWVKPDRCWEEREGLSSQCSSLAFQALRYLRRDGDREVQGSKPSCQDGPGLSPNNAGVLAHLGQAIRDGHRKLVSRLVPLPRLQVGLEGGAGQER